MGPKASFHINLTKSRFGAAIVTVKLRELLTAKIFLVKKKTKNNNLFKLILKYPALGEVLVAELAAQDAKKNG